MLVNAAMKFLFDLFADYHQFYLQDEAVSGDLSDSWALGATENLLAIAPGTIGVGTVRNMTVPVTVEISSEAPSEAWTTWDQVNECSIRISSGRIVVAGCTDYFPEAARIEVNPGVYRARIYYGGLGTLNESQLDGRDCYKVVLWPGDEVEPHVLKRRTI
jgi:hypothetical protein